MQSKATTPIRPADRQASGIGAVFGVDTTGAVFFNTAVSGSSCADAEKEGKLLKGDVLVSVGDHKVYRAPLSDVASKLLGKPGTFVQVKFMREDQYVTMSLERRLTDLKAAKEAVHQAKVESGLRVPSSPNDASQSSPFNGGGGGTPPKQTGSPQRAQSSPQRVQQSLNGSRT